MSLSTLAGTAVARAAQAAPVPLFQLFNKPHPVSPAFTATGKGCFQHYVYKPTKEKLAGLLPTLEKYIYPDFNINCVNTDSPDTQEEQDRAEVIVTDDVVCPPKAAFTSEMGMKRGNDFTKQLQYTLDLYRKKQLPKMYFVDEYTRRQYHRIPLTMSKVQFKKLGIDEENKEQYNICKKLSAAVKQFWYVCHKKEWTPWAPEVIVGNHMIKCGTGVDVIVVTKYNKIILIETKVSGSHDWFKRMPLTSSPLSKPCQDLSPCLYHLHMLQSLMTTEMYKATFPDLYQRLYQESMVMKLSRKDATLYRLTPRIRAKADPLNRLLLEQAMVPKFKAPEFKPPKPQDMIPKMTNMYEEIRRMVSRISKPPGPPKVSLPEGVEPPKKKKGRKRKHSESAATTAEPRPLPRGVGFGYDYA